MEKKKQNNSLRISIIVTMVFILVSTLLLSFAYADSTISPRIENIMAKIRPRGNAIISNFIQSSTENGGSSSSLGHNVHNIFGSISLPNSDSSVTFKVDVSVLLSSEMKITNISGLDNNLEYEFSNYEIGDVLCNSNDECNLGATSELYMTIKYKDGSYNSSNTNYAFNLDFTFETVEYVARIGSNRYSTLKAAIQSVPKNNAETTVVLLKNTSEILSVVQNQNIKLNLQDFVLSNSGNNPVITNNGILKIYNGTITSNASQGAINNEANGVLYMTGGKIQATGTRQAIYNGGRLEMSGTSHLSATTSQRAPLHNLATGTSIITGGTITSTGYYGIENLGSLTIGEKDGTVVNTPVIKGETYGVYTTPTFLYYDGFIEGKTDAVNNENLIDDIETGTEILHAMDGSYKKISLGLKITITFNANGGNVNEASREIGRGNQIGSLPVPYRVGYDFDGWYTEATGGTEVLSTTVFNNDDEIFAHWSEALIYVAEIDGTQYETLQDAVDAVDRDNVKKVINILKNIENENITILSNKNIELDIGSHTITATSGTMFDNYGTLAIKNGTILRNGPNDQNRVIQNRNTGTLIISGGDIKSNVYQVIRNYGTATITGGKIWATTNVDQGLINNENGGRLTISGGQVIGTLRQAIYNDGGTLTITGNVFLTNGSGVTTNRACVQNHRGTTTISGGTITSPATSYPAVLNETTMTITGGNIKSTAQNGVNNTGTLTIGQKDGNINTSSPSISGITNGLNNTGTFKFYDGTIRGVTNSINGNVSEIEDNSTRVDDTELFEGTTYQRTYLQ